jgi:hypothetical protein
MRDSTTPNLASATFICPAGSDVAAQLVADGIVKRRPPRTAVAAPTVLSPNQSKSPSSLPSQTDRKSESGA